MSIVPLPRTLAELLIHSAYDRQLMQMAVTSTFPVNVLLHGPAGTGKTTAMQLIAVEAINFTGLKVSDFAAALRTGDVIVMDQASGYGKDALDSLMERTALISLSGSGRRWVLIDEFDSIETRNANRVKTLLDELKRRDVSVFAATNHIEKVDAAVRNRFREIHMGLFSREPMLLWLKETVKRLGLPPMSDTQAISAVNRAAGSMRGLHQELEQYAWHHQSAGSPPSPPKPRKHALRVLKGGG